MSHLSSATPDAAADPFASVLSTLRSWTGQTVEIRIADENTGWNLAGLIGPLTELRLEEDDDSVEIILGNHTAWLVLHGDAVRAADLHLDQLHIEHDHGNVVVLLR